MEEGPRDRVGSETAPPEREREAGPARRGLDRTAGSGRREVRPSPEPDAPPTELPDWLARKLFRIFR